MTAPVPSWVHMADVPPPVDEELDPTLYPVVKCSSCDTSMLGAGLLEHLEDGMHAWTPAEAAARRWSGTVAALALLAAGALVLVLVLTQQGGTR